MDEPPFKSFVVNGSLSGKPARILIDPTETCCTISGDFILIHSLCEDTRASGIEPLERFVLGTISTPTTSGCYITTWSMSARSLMDHDICLGSDWVKACNIRVVGELIQDPSSANFAILAPTVFWQTEDCALKLDQSSNDSTPASCYARCSASHTHTTNMAFAFDAILIKRTVDKRQTPEGVATSTIGGAEASDAPPALHVYQFRGFFLHLRRYDHRQPPYWARNIDNKFNTFATLSHLVTVSFGINDPPRAPMALSLPQLVAVTEQSYATIQTHALPTARGVSEAPSDLMARLLGPTIALCVEIIRSRATSTDSTYKDFVDKIIQLAHIQLEICGNVSTSETSPSGRIIPYRDYYALQCIFVGLTPISINWNAYLTKEIAECAIYAGKKLYSFCEHFVLYPGTCFDDYSGLGRMRAVVELHFIACTLCYALERYYDLYAPSQNSLDEAAELYKAFCGLPVIVGQMRCSVLLRFASVFSTRYKSFNDPDDLEQLFAISRQCISHADDDELRAMGHINLAYAFQWSAQRSGSQEDHACSVHHMKMGTSLLPDSMAAYKAGTLSILNAVHDIPSQINEVIELQRSTLDIEALLPYQWSSSGVRQSSVILPSLVYRYRASHNVADGEEALRLIDGALSMGSSSSRRSPGQIINLTYKAELLAIPSVPFSDIYLSIAIMTEIVLDDSATVWDRVEAMGSYLLNVSQEARKHIRTDIEAWKALLSLTAYAAKILPRMVDPDASFHSRLRILRSNQARFFLQTAMGLALEDLPSERDHMLQFSEIGLALFWSHALQTSINTNGFKPYEVPKGLRIPHRYLSVKTESGRPIYMVEDSEAAYACRAISFDAGIARTEDEQAAEDAYSAFIDRIVHHMWKILNNRAGNRLAIVLTSIHGACWAIIVTGNGARYQRRLKIREAEVQNLSDKWDKHRANARQALRQDAGELEELDSNSYTADVLSRAVRPSRNSEDTAAKRILAKLWDFVVLPIFQVCGLELANTPNARPRIWWCTSRAFASLPLHAAGNYFQKTICCSDYAISSYTPTLQALIHAQYAFQPVSRDQVRILLGAAPQPFRGSRLPRTTDEVRAVAQIAHEHIIQLPEAEAVHNSAVSASGAQLKGISVQTALNRLPAAQILHIASHGEPNPDKPLEGGFLLCDGKLKISDLLDAALPTAFMAFLSACETAKGGEGLTTQTVHLAGTMMFAGFKSVVATLWSMDDTDGPDIAKTVYRRLFEGDSEFIDPDIIPYALDEAVRALRKKGVSAARWATYIHVGI